MSWRSVPPRETLVSGGGTKGFGATAATGLILGVGARLSNAWNCSCVAIATARDAASKALSSGLIDRRLRPAPYASLKGTAHYQIEVRIA